MQIPLQEGESQDETHAVNLYEVSPKKRGAESITGESRQ